jgi:hypothetical protein
MFNYANEDVLSILGLELLGISSRTGGVYDHCSLKA